MELNKGTNTNDLSLVLITIGDKTSIFRNELKEPRFIFDHVL